MYIAFLTFNLRGLQFLSKMPFKCIKNKKIKSELQKKNVKMDPNRGGSVTGKFPLWQTSTAGSNTKVYPGKALNWVAWRSIQRQPDMESRAEDLASMTIDKQLGDKIESSK